MAPAVACALHLALAAAAPLVLAADTAAAPDIDDPPQPIVPGPQYDAGFLHRLLFGAGYRDLWTTPVALPVLDVASVGGGLQATGTGGGEQTEQLRFKGADGRPYTLRALDKDPTAAIPDELETGIVRDLVRDQTSSQFPTVSPLAAVVLDSLGLLHDRPRLVVLPDHERLGRWRNTFAGRAGVFIEYPDAGDDQPGFAGADEVLDTRRLVTLLRSDPRVRIDAHALLAARLVDLWLGDWDRHEGQWRWADVGPGRPPAYVPVAEDRDQALSRYDGWALRLVGKAVAPQLTVFDRNYPSIHAATWNARRVDRRLLTGLGRDEFATVSATVQGRLTDEVIEAALAALPREHLEIRGPWLEETLRHRRDRLADYSLAFYRHLAKEVDVHLHDVGEEVVIHRHRDGDVTVTARAPLLPAWADTLSPEPAGSVGSAGSAAPDTAEVYRRRFHAVETEEIRIYLEGGDDRVLVTGPDVGPIAIRLVSSTGHDRVNARNEQRDVVVYDVPFAGSLVEAERVRVRSVPHPSPVDGPPPRDWGTSGSWKVGLAVAPSTGLLLGLARERRDFGFQHRPYERMLRADARFAAGRGRWAGSVLLHSPRESSLSSSRLTFAASGLERLNFFGFGNAVPAPPELAHAEIDHEQYSLALGYTRVTGGGFDVTMEVRSRLARTEVPGAGAVAAAAANGAGAAALADADGTGNFGEVSLAVGVDLDRRDRRRHATAGYQAQAHAAWAPPIWDVAGDGYTSARGRLSGFWTPWRPATVAVRLAGTRVWGAYPFFAAAYLGGPESLAGYPRERFAGDTAVDGAVQLRLRLLRRKILVPSQLGLVVGVAAGRVAVDGHSPGDWHPSWQAGIWIAPLDLLHTVSLTVAGSDEDTYVHLGSGFPF
ncbi:MAG: hypothetical protein R6X25_12190 [Candidatus Krumholzibacteriia bacterium]